MTLGHTAMQSQKAVSAHSTSKQILPLGFAEQHTSLARRVLFTSIGSIISDLSGNNIMCLLYHIRDMSTTSAF